MSLPSTKPYLIRAIHQWCCDHGFTPYLSVMVNARTRVPREYVRDGQIVLNVGYEATGNLSIANEGITFQARFGGVARDIAIPISCVSAIYARENGAGMAFDPDDESVEESETTLDGSEDEPDPPSASPPSGRARLHRVK
ncbi:MAG: ClpXP protease specificity-enhancing factor [Candidatus Accumulibacter sp.]|nr:ClpXP protease specificity-enhancing factor [Accumulibacter sp.]